MPADIELIGLQLPGREDRLDAPLLTDWQKLTPALAELARTLPRGPIALYGHSLGALIALELAHHIQQQAPLSLVHLFCAAQPWPGAPVSWPELAAASDEEVLATIEQHFGALPRSLVAPEVRELAMPILRADLSLLQCYRPVPRGPLSCSVSVFAGSDDPLSQKTDYEDWRSETTGNFSVKILPGDHFFHTQHPDDVVHAIVSALGTPPVVPA